MNICKSLFYVTPPRYFINKILRKLVRIICDTVPDMALIAGCTALFILIWMHSFIK